MPRFSRWCGYRAAFRRASSVEQREHAMAQLRSQSRPSTRPRSANMAVTREELVQLAGEANGLIEIGAHTVLHPSVGHLDRERQRFEIVESKRALESMITRPVKSFAYPFGEHCDYNDTSIELLGEAGFDRACTNAFPREAWLFGTNRFRIPRHIAQDWNGAAFANAMAQMFAKHGGGDA